MAETIAKFLLDNPTYVTQKEAIEYLFVNDDVSTSYIYPGKEELIRKPKEEETIVSSYLESTNDHASTAAATA